MTDDELQKRAWSVCCDFHDDPVEIAAHLKRWELEYGKTSAGQVILPPVGWKILPYRTVIPNEHCEYYEDAGWLRPRCCRSTMTPIFARPAGRTRVFAVPGPLAGKGK